ncbi:amino acid permease [Alphaproteobacteria bacterium HT1-32]|nr:amino acid permease [Alphaproteobacteria bacterium HT1-32]
MQKPVALRRRLGLTLLVLYGVGVTVGAGIYVLIGAAARESGMNAPIAFLVSAFVMSFTAASFAELSARFPVSAGEAAYVQAGFGSDILSLVTGALVVGAGIVSSAAITVGSVGYISEFTSLSPVLLKTAVVLAVCAVACWGILESVVLAAVFTVIEVGGLVVIVIAGLAADPGMILRISEVLPSVGDMPALVGIGSAALIAFFAFIGFEDMVNVAEETVDPVRNMPRAIALTLFITTLVYFCVVYVAVMTVSPAELGVSEAPLAVVAARVGSISPVVITGIAIMATLNTIIIQIIMASRVIYGVADRGQLPGFLARINPLTRTPVIATILVSVIVLVLALGFNVERLAATTSQIALTVFTIVNLSLIRLKMRENAPFVPLNLPMWVPVSGVICCLGLLAVDIAQVWV